MHLPRRVYNRLTSRIDGVERVDEELVDVPNWLTLDVRVGDGGWWSEGGLTAHDERRELDLRAGALTRTARLVDREGRSLRFQQRRLVSMDRPHLAVMETTVEPDGWDGPISVRSGIDTSVVNGNATESQLLSNRHLAESAVEHRGDTVLVQVQTVQSEVRIATAVRTRVYGVPAKPLAEEGREGLHTVRFDLAAAAGQAFGGCLTGRNTCLRRLVSARGRPVVGAPRRT